MSNSGRTVLLLVAACASSLAGNSGRVTVEQKKALWSKDSITVLVTDSGLGGLSVCADIAHRADTQHCYRSLRIVFANALPGGSAGYNLLPSMEAKARMFSSALSGMVQRVKPDVILIACNTLSVVYPSTEFAKESSVPVYGIVEVGVQMMAEELRNNPAAQLIIFGTETTVGEDAHRSMLRHMGFAPERMVAEACPNLAGEIQSDPTSDVVSTMIDMFSQNGVQQLPRLPRQTIIGLCCTHYGYVSDQFAAAVKQAVGGEVEVVDPNRKLGDVLFSTECSQQYPRTTVYQSTISRAQVSSGEIEAVARLLESTSKGTAGALRSMAIDTTLFTIPELR